MAVKDYKIEFDDGTIRHRQLTKEDADELKSLADDKGSDIKKVTEGSADPINTDS